MRHSLWPLALAAALAACAPPAPPEGPCAGAACGEPGPDAELPPLAPELEGGRAWLNTTKPLRLADLRGHVVVLDFWTYACVNCLHTLPELAALERRFAGQPVVVIGVHSGKFDAEKDSERIRLAMARHGVEHPVVVDSDFAIWKRYGVTAWPTLTVIGPDGRAVAQASGEPHPGALGDLVAALLDEGAAKGNLASERLAIEAPPLADTGPLAFPGKVAVSGDGRIAVADSGHHRIVLLDGEGQVLETFGSGLAGSIDGDAQSAAFHYPQGLAFDERDHHLYVADTNNHELRAIDLESGQVTTIAGTGQRGRFEAGRSATETPLRSPWALAHREGELFVAMAGAHQIWRHDLASGQIAPYAGTGAERIDDGPLAEATFSQPSGLELVGDTLYVADAEVSAIRAIDLTAGQVRTVVGKGLFDFGDVDGAGATVRLQHALAVTARGDQLYVADTFNNKLKRLDPDSRAVSTEAGGSRAELYEPGGLAMLPDGALIVADTNNHRLRRFEPSTGALSTLPLDGLSAPSSRGLIVVEPTAGQARGAHAHLKAAGRLGPGRGLLLVDIAPPLGGKLSEGTPVSLAASSSGRGLTFPKPKLRGKFGEEPLPLRLPIEVAPQAEGLALIELAYFWCTTGDAGACIPVHATLEVELDLAGAGPGGEARIQHRASPE